jgi:branched-chain amino acid aminotransferase
MTDILGTDEYLQRLVSAFRPGGDKVLAFYDHRVGAICRDYRAMLMPWDDHLVHRGDGVFESIKYVDGRLYQLDAHLRRMKVSADAIHLSPPMDWDKMREIVLDVARASGSPCGMLRLLLGRGPGGFGIDTMECPVSSFYLAAYEFRQRPEELWETGVSAFKSSIPAKQSYLATIKSIDYLPNVLMKREALSKGYDVPICFDDMGFLAEGATENICMVDANGELVVTEFTNCLAGTTMRRAIELINPEMRVQYRKIKEDEIFNARELIIVGTSLDALSIVRYDDRPVHDVRPGPVAKRLRELLRKDLQENGTKF